MFKALLLLFCMFIVACQSLEGRSSELDQSNQRGKEPPVVNESKGDLVLTVSPGDGETVYFLQEQSATFYLILNNEGTDPQTVVSLESNQFTPVLRILDAQGKLMGEYSPNDMFIQILGPQNDRPSPPYLVELQPGLSDAAWVNLWTYTPPLPRGNYAFESRHSVRPDGESITSNQLSFEIADARVSGAVLAYESSAHMSSTLAWIAEPYDKRQKSRVLLRLSSSKGHYSVQNGGTFIQEALPDTGLSLSQVPPGAQTNWLGWLAIVSDNHVELVRHNMTFPQWHSESIELPLSNVNPINRFPDRGHAVFLATGNDPDGKAALTGLIVEEGNASGVPWIVPLTVKPTRSVCAFGVTGTISLLLVSEEENSQGQIITLITRLDVDESGQIVTPERIIRTTENKALAVAVDMRPNAPQAFIVLEVHPQKHDHVALIRIPIDGKPEIPELAPLEGWPAMTRSGKDYEWPPGQGTVDRTSEVRIPLAATYASLETDRYGALWMAMVDEWGDFYGTRLDGSPLTLLREHGEFLSESLHIATVSRSLTMSCFSKRGALVHLGGL